MSLHHTLCQWVWHVKGHNVCFICSIHTLVPAPQSCVELNTDFWEICNNYIKYIHHHYGTVDGHLQQVSDNLLMITENAKKARFEPASWGGCWHAVFPLQLLMASSYDTAIIVEDLLVILTGTANKLNNVYLKKQKEAIHLMSYSPSSFMYDSAENLLLINTTHLHQH